MPAENRNIDSNPYWSTPVATPPPRRRSRLIWYGALLMGLAALSVLVTVICMMWTFQQISATSSTPRPSDLAWGINRSLYPLLVGIPAALVGTALLLLGLITSKPNR